MAWWRSRSKGPTCRREHRWARDAEGEASKTQPAWAESAAWAAAKAASPFESLYTSVNHPALREEVLVPRPLPPHLSCSPARPACLRLRALALAILAQNTLPQISTQLISSLPSGLCSKVTLSSWPSLQRALFSPAYQPLDSPRLGGLRFPKVLCQFSDPLRSFCRPWTLGGPGTTLTNRIQQK